jgi:hypothetical protein
MPVDGNILLLAANLLTLLHARACCVALLQDVTRDLQGVCAGPGGDQAPPGQRGGRHPAPPRERAQPSTPTPARHQPGPRHLLPDAGGSQQVLPGECSSYSCVCVCWLDGRHSAAPSRRSSVGSISRAALPFSTHSGQQIKVLSSSTMHLPPHITCVLVFDPVNHTVGRARDCAADHGRGGCGDGTPPQAV